MGWLWRSVREQVSRDGRGLQWGLAAHVFLEVRDLPGGSDLASSFYWLWGPGTRLLGRGDSRAGIPLATSWWRVCCQWRYLNSWRWSFFEG